jgi:lipid II:glycine glycyltransferase (peptidoglycan interpeptide bridge formation enzyme)
LIDEEELWNNLHVKHRNVIRNSIKKGVEIVINPKNLDDLYDLMKLTMDRSNIWFFTRPEFNLYMTKMEGKQMYFIAYYNGVAQGCAIMPFSNHASYYSYGGSVKRPLTGAINYMHWEAIKYFKSLGVRSYDFVGARIKPVKGSKLEGIQRFKSRFGGELIIGYLWKFPLNKTNYRIFRFLLMCKKRTFVNFTQDVIDQELKL